jgi:hypothetical protein
MNWRSIVGLVFLLVGMKALYAIIEGASKGGLKASPWGAGIGSVVWMAVGVFLIMQGIRKKEN